MLAGCGSIRAHKGYIVDPVLVSSVQPGVDNRVSVERTLGRPSFTSQFDQKDWYYLSRNTRQLAFGEPIPVEQMVLHIRFDDAGNVVQVNQTGLEQVARINPDGDKTPTLGRDRTFFEDLFGNIGAVGAPGAGGAGGPSGP
ncbi:MAG: outer membrane protein assembly factor BamE [Blastomonas sp.]